MLRQKATSKIIFLHIAKTAGTSLVEYFKQRLPSEEFSSHGDFISQAKRGPISEEHWQKLTFISGHFGFDYIANVIDDAYSVTFLRDPLHRALSFYKFCLYPDMQKNYPVARAAKALGLNGFLVSELPEVRVMLNNQQTWQLACKYWEEDRAALSHMSEDDLLDLAKKNLKRFSYVGVTESFDMDFLNILKGLELPAPDLIPHELPTPKPVNLKRLSNDTLRILAQRQSLDRRLYEWVKEERSLCGAWSPYI